jgi:hypothetical protein
MKPGLDDESDEQHPSVIHFLFLFRFRQSPLFYLRRFRAVLLWIFTGGKETGEWRPRRASADLSIFSRQSPGLTPPRDGEP